ncbi:hypothetical protein OF83DRAFT_1173152 [Amylostereum chailletii]|nr:hypothetical protein OF83DRAFT_1173152 [Amylostereum chailletii]
MVDVARPSPIPTYAPLSRSFPHSFSKSPTVSNSPTGSRTSSPGVKNHRARHDGPTGKKLSSPAGSISRPPTGPPARNIPVTGPKKLKEITLDLAKQQYNDTTTRLSEEKERHERNMKRLNDAAHELFHTLIPFAIPESKVAQASDAIVTEEELALMAYDYKKRNKDFVIIPPKDGWSWLVRDNAELVSGPDDAKDPDLPDDKVNLDDGPEVANDD